MGPCEDTCGTLWAQKTRLSLKSLVGGGRGRAPKTGSAPRSISDLCSGSQIPGAWRAGCSHSGPSAPVQTRKKSPRVAEGTRLPQGCSTQRSPFCMKIPAMRFLSFSSPCIEHVESQLSCGQISVTAPDVHHGSVLWEAEEGGVPALHTPSPSPRSPPAVCCFSAGAPSSSFHSLISLVTYHCCHQARLQSSRFLLSTRSL